MVQRDAMVDCDVSAEVRSQVLSDSFEGCRVSCVARQICLICYLLQPLWL